MKKTESADGITTYTDEDARDLFTELRDIPSAFLKKNKDANIEKNDDLIVLNTKNKTAVVVKTNDNFDMVTIDGANLSESIRREKQRRNTKKKDTR